jgi:hypothetical protein
MDRIRRFLAATSVILAASSCTIGTQLSSVDAANSPRGSSGTITTRAGDDREIAGELIAVQEDGLLVLTESDSVLTLVRFSNIADSDFGDVPMLNGTRDNLEAISRYPFGLEGGRLQRLLEALGQSSVVEVGP